MEVWLKDVYQGIVNKRDDWFGEERQVDGVRDNDATLIEIHLHHIQLLEGWGNEVRTNKTIQVRMFLGTTCLMSTVLLLVVIK